MIQEPTMLQSGHFLLRPFDAQDAPALFTLANNPGIAKNLRDIFPSPYTHEDAGHFIRLASEGKAGYCRAIIYRQRLAGAISLVPQHDVYRHSAEIGYWLGETFWNQGIATEAIRMICLHAFEQMGILRIFAGVFAGNQGSLRALEKNGFVREGIRAKAILKNNQLLDEHLMALIKT